MVRGVHGPGGAWSWGVHGPGGCMVLGGAWSKGVGGVIPSCTEAAPSPPVNRMTNRCKNITLPQTSFAGGKNTAF